MDSLLRNSSSDDTDPGLAESSRELLPKATSNRLSPQKQPNSGSGLKNEEVWKKQDEKAGFVTDDTNSSTTYNRRDSDVIINEIGHISEGRKYAAVVILFLINLLNYMDRYTIAGVLIQIQTYFDVDNGQAGLLQTIFLISYMITAPLFGYLGDRYNRKIILFFGITFWIGSTLAASFINDGEMFWLFMLFRALVGIGEASYSTIAPTIISDLFVGNKRTFMLGLFFFAIPVGSGLGYVAGSGMEKIFGSWHWALRLTPAVGFIVVVVMMFVIPDVPRGAADGDTNIVVNQSEIRSSGFKGYMEDLAYIAKNKSFWLVTWGLTFMAFAAGSLSFWGPKYVAYALIVADKLNPCTGSACEYSSIGFTFGIILCISGFGGVVVGLLAAKKYSQKRNDSDALICAVGLLLSGPCLLAGFELSSNYTTLSWLMIFFGNLTMCFTWTPSADMTLYIIHPNRRSTAYAVQILIMHLFGDAGSPYLIGVISDYLQHGKADTYVTKFLALKYAFYMTPFAVVIGGSMFLFSSLFVGKDRKKVQDALKGTPSGSSTSSSDIELASTSQLLRHNNKEYMQVTTE